MSVWLIYRLVLGCAVDYNRGCLFFDSGQRSICYFSCNGMEIHLLWLSGERQITYRQIASFRLGWRRNLRRGCVSLWVSSSVYSASKHTSAQPNLSVVVVLVR